MGRKRFIIWFRDISREKFDLVGGKNVSLGDMTRMGIRVPPGFAVTTYAYEFFMKKTGLEKVVFPKAEKTKQMEKGSLSEICEEIRGLIISRDLPDEIIRDIEEAYQKLCEISGRGNLPVAVRSSATAEDLPWASFAGLQDTYLWISGIDEVIRNIKKCWASLFSDRAVSYRNDMGFSHTREKISVTVQKMVNSRSAGVLFTLNPATGDMGEIVIDSSWGLGEAVVSGEVSPDEFFIDKKSLEVRKRILGEKAKEIVPHPEGRGTIEKEVEDERRKMFSLSDDEIEELVRLGLLIENYYKSPSDIEWAIDKDMDFPENIFILQARPETVWSDGSKGEPEDSKDKIIDLIAGFFKK